MSNKLKSLQVRCPACKQPIELTEAAANSGGLFDLACPKCQKKFRARFPAATATSAETFTDLNELQFDGLENETPLPIHDWSGNRSKFRLDRTALRIALAAAIIVFLIGGAWTYFQQNDFRLPSIDMSMFEGQADTHARIFDEYQKCVSQLSQLVEGIDHRSDCQNLMAPLERLQERQRRLITRVAQLGLWRDPVAATDEFQLPEYPPTRSTRRIVEVFLTPEFREAENQVNQAGDAVLAWLHQARVPGPLPASDFQKNLAMQLKLYLDVVLALAELEGSASEESVAVRIHEIAAALRELRVQQSQLDNVETPAAATVQAQQLLKNAIEVQSRRFVQNPESSIGKALAVLDSDALEAK